MEMETNRDMAMEIETEMGMETEMEMEKEMETETEMETEMEVKANGCLQGGSSCTTPARARHACMHAWWPKPFWGRNKIQ